jgi:broad specificity phosphatase PhoE
MAKPTTIFSSILFTRHEEHVNQVLLPDARLRAISRGQALKTAGYNIKRLVLSPAPRAIATALAMCEGYGSADMPLALEPRIGDFKSDSRTPAGSLKKLKELAKKLFGDTEDASLAGALIKTPSLYDFLFQRAVEGAIALSEMTVANPSDTALVTSHGVARMEIVLRYLRGYRGVDLLDISNELIPRGQIVRVTFAVTAGVAEFIFAEPLVLLPEEAR